MLPNGLSMNASTCEISGTTNYSMTVAQYFTVTVLSQKAGNLVRVFNIKLNP